MYNKCCVVNCESRRKDVILHHFPKSEIGLQKWLKCLSINGVDLRSMSVDEVRKLFVCHKHFEARFFTNKLRLVVGAYPSLFNENEIATGIPEKVYMDTRTSHENTSSIMEHDYTRKRRHEDHTYYKKHSIEATSSSSGVLEPMPTTSISATEVVNPRDVSLCAFEPMETNICANTMADPISSLGTVVTPSSSGVLEEIPTPSICPSGVTDSMPSTSILVTEVMDQRLSEPMEQETNVYANTMVDPVSTPSADATTQSICVTPKKAKGRRRLIKSFKSLTPNCKKLYREYRKSQKQLDFSRRAKRAVTMIKSKSFEELIKQMNPVAKKIFWMQIRQQNKKSKGRRFTREEKFIGLSIMKQSPKCYKFLQKIFILPSKTTLNKMISDLDIESGINPQIFEAIKQEVNSWVTNKKFCTIIFDEVALEAGVTYDKKKDALCGLVELDTKTNDLADHALVFMLRGALYKWQQPIAFYFCKGATSRVHLKNIIKTVVSAVNDCGLMPVALVCDQGTAFCSALKSLQDDTKRDLLQAGHKIDDVIIIKGHALNIIYDPPHLLKGLRNNFLSKNIKYEDKISKWDDIVYVYKKDCKHAQMRLLPKLNDEHVIPEKIKKMKVKNCARVFSKTVARALLYSSEFATNADGTEVSRTLESTSEMVSFFDDLFDSVNGAAIFSKSSCGKPLRTAVTPDSNHNLFWEEAKTKLKKIRFVDRNGKETVVPSLKNWIHTLESYQRLWQFFKKRNVEIMRPRYFNSDPIENFFGQMRAYNFRNNDPSCHIFKCTFKSLLITGFIKFHSSSFNCEDASAEPLLKLFSLFEKEDCSTQTEEEIVEIGEFQNLTPESLQSSARQERINVHSRAYASGWVIRKILSKIKCTACEKSLTSETEEPIHKWISYREYKCIKRRKLTYPSEHAVRLFSRITEEAIKYLEYQAHHGRIFKNIINTITSEYSFDFLQCEIHKRYIIENFLGFTLRLAVFNWCNIINKIIKGIDVSRLESKSLPPMQLKALQKFKTKLKNKRHNK